MDSHWLAWAAGIIDGEGCIGFTKCNGHYALRLEVANTDPRMLDKLREMFGGSIKVKTWKPPATNQRPAWRWYLSTAQAANVLVQVLPWLVTKHEQAELAILSRQFVNRSGKPDPVSKARRIELSHRITQLKHQSFGPAEQSNPPKAEKVN